MRNVTWWVVLIVALGAAVAQAPGSVTAPATGSALVGALAPDGVAQGTLVAEPGGVVYHTYWVDVPAGVARWTLTLDADTDLDLALKLGSEIGSYDDRDRGGDWDYRDWETGNPTVIVVEAPQAGRWYVDVFNALQAGARGSYRLSLAVSGAQAAPPVSGEFPRKGAFAVPPTPVPPAIVRAPTTGPAVVGALALEGVGEGALVSTTEGIAFHTYWVDVPAGVARWTLTLDADADLDVAVKFGAEIGNYADRERGGDWDYRDMETGNPTVIVVEAPQAGRWYVDVLNALQVGARGGYRLTSTAGATVGPAPVPAPPAPPVFGGGSTPATTGFAGSYRLVGGDVLFSLQQDGAGKLTGSLSGADARYTVDGISDAQGTYGIIYDAEGGMFFMAELVGNGLRLTLYDADANGNPVESSARALDFERVGASPVGPPVPPDGLQPAPPRGDAGPPESGTVVELRVGAQAQAGDRIRSAYVGTSFVVPPEWQGWVADEPLLPVYIGSQTLPGMAVVLTTHGVTLEQFAQVLSEAIELEDGAVLRPTGAPQLQGDQVSVRYAAAGGVGVGVARTAGGPGVIALYLGGAGQEAVGASLVGALAASTRFEPGAAAADLQRAQQDWRGHRMWTYSYGSGGSASSGGIGGRFSGEFEAHWDLCADGRYLHDGRTEHGAFAATAATSGLASGAQFFGGVDADAWSGRGHWTFAAIGDRVVLLLFDAAGSWSYYELGRAADGSVTLDGMPLERRAAGGC